MSPSYRWARFSAAFAEARLVVAREQQAHGAAAIVSHGDQMEAEHAA